MFCLWISARAVACFDFGFMSWWLFGFVICGCMDLVWFATDSFACLISDLCVGLVCEFWLFCFCCCVCVCG